MPPTSRIKRPTTVASTGRRMKRSVKAFITAPSRFRRYGRRRQGERIVDRDRRLVLQLDLPRGDDLLARLDPVFNGDPFSARCADMHEPALDDKSAGGGRRRGGAGALPRVRRL